MDIGAIRAEVLEQMAEADRKRKERDAQVLHFNSTIYLIPLPLQIDDDDEIIFSDEEE